VIAEKSACGEQLLAQRRIDGDLVDRPDLALQQRQRLAKLHSD